MCSLFSVRRSKNDWPQSLIGFGSFETSASAAGENWPGETLVPVNGARSAIVRPELHAGDVIVEKSPASIAAVGTNWKKLVGLTFFLVP
jgi:hypothetical protein